MGRGDFRIINDEGHVIADMKSIHHFPAETPQDIRFVTLPVLENACLFAAAPDLYDACVKALAELKKTAPDRAVVAKLEAAINKAQVRA